LSEPAFSPDGSQIAYFQSRTDFNSTLRVMNADGSGSRVVLQDSSVMKSSNYHPLLWFPDGRRLLFGMGFGAGAIYTVNADGSELTQVGQGWYPTVSPDGARIAYGLDPSGPETLTIENVDGTHVHHINLGIPGPWNPLPEAASEAHSASAPPSTTRPDWITYSIAALVAASLVSFWLRRKRTASA
jgi:Tol biopolymer transport system component